MQNHEVKTTKSIMNNYFLRPIHKLRNIPYWLTLIINVGIYTDYQYQSNSLDDRSTKKIIWFKNHTVSLHSFALSEGDIRPLLLSAFSHVHPAHLVMNMLGLAYANILLSRVSKNLLIFPLLYVTSAFGGSVYFLSDQWRKTIQQIQKENPLLYQNVLEAMDDYKSTYLDFYSGSKSSLSSSNANQQEAILAFKQTIAIEAFRTAVIATPAVYPILNSAGLGASGAIMGMFTYASLKLLQFRRPGLALYMSILMGLELYAVHHPDDYELVPPHRYSHRPGEEVSDYPELTKNHQHDKPLVDPQNHRHFVIGHAAHIGGGLTGITIFLFGQTGTLFRNLYRNSGKPLPFSPILRSPNVFSTFLPKNGSSKWSIGLLAASSLTDQYYRTK